MRKQMFRSTRRDGIARVGEGTGVPGRGRMGTEVKAKEEALKE